MFYFYVYFFLFLIFPWQAMAYFPWKQEEPKETPFYKLKIDTQVMRFFNESDLRYFAGAQLNIKDPLFDIKTSYTYSINENHHYFRPHQINLKLKVLDGQWVIGRTLKEWDWADLFWKRSLWQPIHTDDVLRPQWSGLTGVFRDFNYTDGQVNLFGSFIFIPNFGPPFENEDGTLVSKNPWFIPPPSGKIKPTNIVPKYIINENKLKDFLQLSLGGRVSYKDAYIAYAYKPMNQIKAKSLISLPLDKKKVGSYETGWIVEAPIEPVIISHHLISGGLTLETNQIQNNSREKSINYRLKTSFTFSHPEKHTVENEKWVFFQPESDLHISAKGEIHVKDSFEETTLHIAYTHLFHPIEKTKNLAEKVVPNIEKQFFRDDLFDFSKAASTGITHSIKFNEDQLAKIKLRLIYNLLTDFFLFSFYGSITFAEAFSIFLSGDILFSEFPFSIDKTKENIGVYENKSRIFGGLSYEF